MCIGNPTMQYPDRIVMQFVSNLHGTRIRMSLPSHLHAFTRSNHSLTEHFRIRALTHPPCIGILLIHTCHDDTHNFWMA